MAEREGGSGLRELQAILYVLRSFVSMISHKRVQVFTDSMNAVAIIDHGSGVPHLQQMALDIFWFVKSHAVTLSVSWVPRSENQKADAISKWQDTNDWRLNSVVFANLNAKWGVHTVDRFASHINAQLPRFNSYLWCPGTEAVNCFTQCWRGGNNWCNPPFAMMGKLIRFIVSQECMATVIIPLWWSAPWWPVLCPAGEVFLPCVVGWVEIPRSIPLFFPGFQTANELPVGNPNWRVLAVRFVFGQGWRQRPCLSVPRM
jgi:hypothetical protein